MLMICLLAMSSLPVFAQEVTGSLIGKVMDEQGAVVKGATVDAVSPQRTQSVQTDDEGGYQFLNLPPGVYTVSVSATGFGTTKRENVTVELGRTYSVNFDVKPMVGESVTVSTSDEPIVDVTSTKTATNVTQAEFEVIPKTLNFSSVINVAPGTRQESKSAGFTIDGASGAENVFIIDGVEVTNVQTGQLRRTNNIPFDFVKEVQIKSAGYEAEFGGATGGVINVVTRSGTNDWHGEARFEFQNDALRADDNPALRLNPADPRVAEYFYNPKGDDDYRIFQPTFLLGGPLVKDHVWFFASYAPQFEKQVRRLDLVNYVSPSQTDVLESRDIEYKTKYDYSFARLDFSVNKFQANTSFTRSPIRQEGPPTLLAFQTTSRTSFDNPRYPFQGGYSPSWQFTGAATYNLTDNLILSFRGGRTYFNDKAGSYDIPVGQPLVNIIVPCVNGGNLDCAPGTTSTGFATIQNNLAIIYDITKRTNINVDATYVTRFFGQQHIFKGGYQINRLANNVDSGQQGGIINFYFDRQLFAGDPTSRGDAGYYRVTDFGTKGDVSSRNQSLFFQDAWTVGSRLTLNLGLRFENEYLPTFPIDATFHPSIDPADLATAPPRPIEFGWGDKVAPRIGVAWDVFGDQKLKVFGSFGFFYDTMKYELPRGSFGGDHFLRSWYTLDTADFRGITLTNRPGTLLLGPTDFRVPSSLAPKPGEQPGIDPNLLPTREREYTVGAEYAFTSNLLGAVRFTRKQLDRTIEDIGRHDADGNEIYTIGNPGFGVSQDTTFFAPFPAPKAVRNYTGLEFRLDKRFSNNWYANITYLYSRLVGNYAGLASSDEVTNGVGRSSPNVNRYYDFPTLLFTSSGEETLGRLPTDRPHTLKVYAAYRFNWWGMSTDIGGTQLAYSGTPVSTRVETLFAEHLFFGRGDLGRTEAFTQTDLVINHRWNINERVAIKGSFNVLNLFDQRAEQVRFEERLAPGVELPLDESNFPVSAYTDYLTLNGNLRGVTADDLDPRFNLPTIFQDPRQARFSIGVEF